MTNSEERSSDRSVDLETLDAWLLELGSSHDTDPVGEPMPDEVFARLQAAIGEQQPLDTDHAPVLSLHNRRRRGTWLLAAAAAVLAFALLPQVLPRLGVDDRPMSGASDSSAGDGLQAGGRAPEKAATKQGHGAESGLTDGRESAQDFAAPSPGAASAAPEGRPMLASGAEPGRTPEIVAGRELAGLQRVIRQRSSSQSGYHAATPVPARCRVKAWPEGDRVVVRYQGEPAVAIIAERADGSTVGTLFRCRSAIPVAATTLP